MFSGFDLHLSLRIRDQAQRAYILVSVLTLAATGRHICHNTSASSLQAEKETLHKFVLGKKKKKSDHDRYRLKDTVVKPPSSWSRCTETRAAPKHLLLENLEHEHVDQDRLDVHLKLCVITGGAALRSSAVVVQKFSVVGLLVQVFGGASHTGNVGQTAWRGPGQRRAATVQQELPLVDDPRTARGGAEQGSSGGRGVVMGHVGCVVDGHPPGGRDGLGSGLLAVSGHLLSGVQKQNYQTK